MSLNGEQEASSPLSDAVDINQNVKGCCSLERNDNEDIDSMMGDLVELRRCLENKKSLLLEKERQLRQEHETANWWQIVVPLLTEYRRLLALLFSLTNSFTASYTDVSADHCCCESDCLKRQRSVSSGCTVSEMSVGVLTSEGCRCCKQYQTHVNCAKGGYVNGEIGFSADVAGASARPAAESHTCKRTENKLSREPDECEKSRVLCKSSDTAGKMTEQLPDGCETSAHQECAEHLSAVNSRNSRRFTSDVQSQPQQLTNGIDESHSERSSSCTVTELNSRSDDVAVETAKNCTSSVDTSCVSESTRQNILDAAETFASIIGREIAASFDLKEGKLTSPESQGDAGGSFSSTDCSTACITGSSSSTRTLQSGSKMLGEDGKSDKGPPLDTVEVARRVRDVLAANNVGQRQFARCVLGLSQGTVSELLAKPKPWDRLTEKGKDSYRRMNQWAGDHLGVSSLKDHLNSIALKANLPSPKVRTVPSKKQDSAETEQRVAQILSEAQRAIHQQTAELQKEDNDSSGDVSLPTPSSSERPPATDTKPKLARSKRDRRRAAAAAVSPASSQCLVSTSASAADDSSNPVRDLVARIYKEELRKLMSVAELKGNDIDARMYEREIKRLTYLRAGNAVPKPSSQSSNGGMAEDKENINGVASANSEDVVAVEDDMPQDLSIGRQKDAVDALTPESLVPADTGSDNADSHGVVVAGLSPLQRMQCIANSLPATTITQSVAGALSSRQLLPPISAEQMAACEEMNTDDIVAKIKEVLSQFSISQRLFGDAVLGLSQGSVSDLLARPKPWPLLTQKGREPFIRMQAFLDDPDAVSKLVATQYRVPADKLLRNSSAAEVMHTGMSIDSSCSMPSEDDLGSQSASSALFTGLAPLFSPAHIAESSRCSSSDSFPPTGIIPVAASCAAPVIAGSGLVPVGPTLFPFLPIPPYFTSAQGPVAPVMMAVDLRSVYSQQSNASATVTVKDEQPASANVSEELDTQELTTRVRDLLQSHGLGQKLFGEAVLELSQGSVSELLAKPKPWSLLSAKGREPFLRMRAWLADPHGIERLRAFQSQTVAGYKRKSNSDSGSESANGTTTAVSQKKPRLFFTEEQKMALRQAYISDPYPNQAAIERLAADIGVGVKTVVNWFHNHRMRAKQQPVASTDLSASSSTQCLASQVKDETGIASSPSLNAEQQSSVDSLQDGTEPHSSDGSSLCTVFDVVNTPGSTSAKSRTKNLSAASKRKRAKPHRLSTGTVVDRTERQDTDSNHAGDAIDLHAAASEACSGADEAASVNKWVEAERERNIERLQRNLEQEPAVDWEF